MIGNTLDIDKEASKRLKDKHDFFKSWAAVAEDVGINRGVLCSVANGKRKASPAVLRALGLPPRTVAVTPCARCGHVHVTKRCTDKTQPTKYAKHPVMRLSRVRNALFGYGSDS